MGVGEWGRRRRSAKVLAACEWVGVALSFLGTLMVAKHIHSGWILNTLADVFFVIFATHKKLWGFFSLCAGYAALNLFGWLS